LNKRGAIVVEEELLHNTPLYMIKAYLPVAKSFGFASALREQTKGMSFPQCVFDHWKVIEGDVFEKNSAVNKVVIEIRNRKGLKNDLPNFKDFNDKL